ncbi:MAG: aminotransferase class V-fold PLP-dependent enzyme [Acidobacteriota bacterium]|nr:aminotransferase class V-fold PLP-dependent enzyme [Acidobacteriota bacterium]
MNEQIRRLFPITEQIVYLNSAAVSPPPTIAVEAINEQLRDVQMYGSRNYRQWVGRKENCRRLLASLINARTEQIAFLRNTSDALSTIANGLKWKAGENIVTFQNEFPSNVYPWRRIRDNESVELRFCPERNGRIDLDELISLIDEKTRVVAISAVQYASGFSADLKRIGEAARAVDALLVVDAIQAVGVVPIDVEADLIDAAAGASHKWLMSPEGIGYIYLSDRARSRVEPTLVGWISVEQPEDYSNFEQQFKAGALAWETGTFASSLFYAVEANLKLLIELGVGEINKYLIGLGDFLCEALDKEKYELVSSRRENEKSQIVCIRNRSGAGAMQIYKHLQQQNIIVAPRGDRLRISPHIYNTREDIEKLIAGLP